MANFLKDTQDVIEVEEQQPTIRAKSTQLAIEVFKNQPTILTKMSQIVIEIKQSTQIAVASWRVREM